MSEDVSQTGDMAAAVEAAFAASTPDAATAPATEQSTPASVSQTPVDDAGVTADQSVDDDAPLPEGQPVPYQRFTKVNQSDQARKQELERLAWARGVDPTLAQSALQLLSQAKVNPLVLTEELETLRDHPVFGPQLRSWAARTLGTRVANVSQPTAEPLAEEPQPDLQLQDGTLVYSAKQQQAHTKWVRAQVQAEVDQRLNPLLEGQKRTNEYVANQELVKLEARAQSEGLSELTEMRKQPHFTEHEPDIKQLMIANPRLSLKEAYSQVFVEKVIPKIAQGKAATQQQKVGASSANPARPSGAVSGPPKDFHEALTRALVNS